MPDSILLHACNNALRRCNCVLVALGRAWVGRASVSSLLTIAWFCLSYIPVDAGDLSVSVNPSTGVDSLTCSILSPCKTIAYAVQSRSATVVSLCSGIFNESSVIIHGVLSLSISGVHDGTVFDCGYRTGSGNSDSDSLGPAFFISNSSITLSGITFQNCVNFVATGPSGAIGGAVSAFGSSVTINNCSFYNNSAQSGGAVGVLSSTLLVTSSAFESNTATCPNAAFTVITCSAWGGAISSSETLSVSLLRNTFSNNMVNLVLNAVTNATSQSVGGGGCISIVHRSNVNGSLVLLSRNLIQNCTVRMYGSNDGLSTTSGVQYGMTYGGAVSLYYGLSTSSCQVQNVTFSFTHNSCLNCVVASSVGVSGNAYGGCLSIYAGSWNVNPLGDSSVGELSAEDIRMNFSSRLTWS